jgi:hypothetical protein
MSLQKPNTTLLLNLRIWAIYLLVITLSVFYYYKTIFGPYICADDSMFFVQARHGEYQIFEQMAVSFGRWISTLAVFVGVQLIPSIESIWILNLISLIGLLLSAWVLDSFLKKLPISILGRIFIATVLIFNPAAGVQIGWSTCFSFHFGMFLALLAGKEAVNIFTEKSSSKQGIRIAIVMLLLLCSLNIYQISAACFLIPSMAQLLFSTQLSRDLKMASKAVIIYLVTIVIAFGILKLSIHFWGGFAHLKARSSLVTDLGERLHFLTELQFSRGLGLWLFFYDRQWQYLFFGFTATLTLWTIIRERKLISLTRICIFFPVFALLANLILIIKAENDFPFRVIVMSYLVNYLMIAFFLEKLIALHAGKLSRAAIMSVQIALCMIIYGTGFHIQNEGWARPQITEFRKWKAHVDRMENRPSMVFYREPQLGDDRSSTVMSYYEFGHGSISYSWFTINLLNQLLDERFGLADAIDVPLKTALFKVQSFERIQSYLTTSAVFIDGFECVGNPTSPTTFESSIIDDPVFGILHLIDQPRVVYSDWFGLMDFSSHPWILHSKLGWMHGVEPQNGGIQFYNDRNMKCWTSRETYPAILEQGDDQGTHSF